MSPPCWGSSRSIPAATCPTLLLELVEKEGVTFSHCVPTILHMLLKHPHAQRIDLSGWKLIIGGAAMSRALCLEAMSRGIDVFTGYGMSETCPILTMSHLTPEMLELSPEEQAVIRCKTGRSLPLVDLQVVDSQLQEQPRDNDSAGEIVVRAPWLTQGYLKDHKASERLWEGGYLHTGDVAVRDELGYVRITDRTKDVIKVAGEWVSSLELEDIIAHHPGVAEVAVIGLPDEKWGERPLALVVPTPGQQLTEKDISHHVKEYADKGLVNKQVVLLKVACGDHRQDQRRQGQQGDPAGEAPHRVTDTALHTAVPRVRLREIFLLFLKVGPDRLWRRHGHCGPDRADGGQGKAVGYGRRVPARPGLWPDSGPVFTEHLHLCGLPPAGRGRRRAGRHRLPAALLPHRLPVGLALPALSAPGPAAKGPGRHQPGGGRPDPGSGAGYGQKADQRHQRLAAWP